VPTLALVLLLANAPSVKGQTDEIGEAVSDMITEAKEQVEAITVETLAQKIAAGDDVFLLDVRTKAEYDAGHLQNAVWIPRGRVEFAAAGGSIPTEGQEVIVYCRTQGRSPLAAAALQNLGYNNARYLDGGFSGWAEAGYSFYNLHGELTAETYGKNEED
jgi:rhodanese-related sulfurtransferase